RCGIDRARGECGRRECEAARAQRLQGRAREAQRRTRSCRRRESRMNDRANPGYLPARPSATGQALSRVDGEAKVRGRAKYAAEFPLDRLCYGVMVRSTIPSGTITAIDSAAVKRMPGVIFVLTHENAPQLPEKGRAAVNPPAGREMSLFQDPAVRYNGEPGAGVVAETLEQATAGAAALR